MKPSAKDLGYLNRDSDRLVTIAVVIVLSVVALIGTGVVFVIRRFM